MLAFTELCTELGVDPSNPNQQGLDKLKAYTQANISRDKSFSGDMKKQFEGYKALVQQYIEVILPNLSMDIHEEISALNDMSLLEYISRNGLDRCLQKIAPSAIQLKVFYGLMSPLHIAASMGYAHTGEVLLGLGADPSAANSKNELPINYVLRLPMRHEKALVNAKQALFKSLYKKAPETLAHKAEDGDTLVHQMAISAYSNLLKSVTKNRPEMVFEKNNHGRMPIHAAILNAKKESVEILLGAAKASDMVDYEGNSPLHYAARYASPEILKLCAAALEDVDILNQQKRTPLMLAAYQGMLNNAKALVELGADPLKTDASGSNALQIAIHEQQLEIAEYLSTLEGCMQSLSDDDHHEFEHLKSDMRRSSNRF